MSSLLLFSIFFHQRHFELIRVLSSTCLFWKDKTNSLKRFCYFYLQSGFWSFPFCCEKTAVALSLAQLSHDSQNAFWSFRKDCQRSSCDSQIYLAKEQPIEKSFSARSRIVAGEPRSSLFQKSFLKLSAASSLATWIREWTHLFRKISWKNSLAYFHQKFFDWFVQ